MIEMRRRCIGGKELYIPAEYQQVEYLQGDGKGTYIDAMVQTAEQLKAMSPIDITMGMLSNNFSWSIVLSLPIALMVSVRKPNKQNHNQ